MMHTVVVGASAGGLATAEGLRRLGYDGALTVVGDEAHPPYDRPPLSKQILSGAWAPDRLPLRPPTELRALDARWLLATAATAVDPGTRTVSLADGEHLGYDHLVVATGVRPRRLPGAEAPLDGLHTLRTLEDALRLRSRLAPGRRLVVVGAGFIGAEAAAVGRGLGVRVTMVEPAPVPLAHAVGSAIGTALSRAHLEHGVDLRTGTAVARVLTDPAHGQVTGVELSDGSTVDADDVLVGIGSLPNTEWLEGSGLPVDDGLLCDRYSAAAPRVWGVGDVARWFNPLFGRPMRVEHRAHAAEHGLAVARNILDAGTPRPFAPVPYFWSDQYDLKIQAYGYLRGHQQVAVIEGDLDSLHFLAAYRTGDRLSGVLAVGMPPRAVRPWRAALAAGRTWSEATSLPATA
ncbi:FAD-dependent oxidoreductase [Streptomyces sp. MAA16]|uniref:NAD(P)/FAD-dependent oxidoreductase n=1 Tax=Streptomyces sp. MAA16 TaxID=3035116 RepID=UPI002474224A|nr:FAD-dependent oxidoreductase [Streptomyces sp. MAA16]